MLTFPSKHISIAVEKTASVAYAFLSDPMNLPLWASGVGRSFQMIGADECIAETDQGQVTIVFTESNDFGVVDYQIVRPSGEALLAPMRVVSNGSGSEVTVVIFQSPGVSDAYFERNADAVAKDLQTLKRLLEE